MVGDGMVLQREMPIRIWGFATPGEKVTVRFAGETGSGVTEDNGIWVVILGPKKAGGPYTMDINGINHIWLQNIMIGDVWVCAGGEHMELPLGALKDTGSITHAADLPIREFHVPLRYDFKGPRENVTAHWEPLTPERAPEFSAIAWFFAKEVYEAYHVPIGLIDVCAAGAPAEAWLSPRALKDLPAYAAVAARYADSSQPEGKEPADPRVPGGLFNGMLAPISLYTVRGVLWWQGEANVAEAKDYGTVLPALIEDWRVHWGDNDLPFVYVQLEGHGPVRPWAQGPEQRVDQGAMPEPPQESQWAELRDAQRLTLTLPATGMAVSADLGETDAAHPGNLPEIARRLMLAAESAAYGKKNFIYTGPLYQSMKAHGNKVHLMFDEVNTDLIVKGGGELRGFTIAGADFHYVPAKAITDGKKVIVWSDAVAHPVSVRYGWADDPAGINLFNRDILFKDGLPASPFEGHIKVK